MGTESQPSWSRERSSDRDCLVSILYGRRSSGPNATPARAFYQRTYGAGRTTQVVVSSRSITSSAGRFEGSKSTRDGRPAEGGSR